VVRHGRPAGASSNRGRGDEGSRVVRDTAASILDEFAKRRRVCLRSKRWWNEEIAELRKAKGRALRTNWDRKHETTRVARRDLRRAIRRAKNCWDNFLENASGEDVWTAVRYTNPRLDDSAKPLVNGERTAVTRDDKEQMILVTAFPEPPSDNGIKAPQAGAAHRAVKRPLVGSILAGCSNRSAPGEDRMGAEVVKLLWEPERTRGIRP